jgi:hypothetical protein
MNYFAYGSNIDINRMISRGVNPISIRKGILDNYKFIINKMSKADPSIGYANVVPEDGSFVWRRRSRSRKLFSFFCGLW